MRNWVGIKSFGLGCDCLHLILGFQASAHISFTSSFLDPLEVETREAAAGDGHESKVVTLTGPTQILVTPQRKEMAAKILANLLVMGGGILARAFVQAYRQALANASKTGVAQETLQNTVRRASKAMTEQEARQILGVTEETAWEEILKKYDVLFEKNAKNGSFYIQSKVHRAKECLESVYQGKGQSTPS
ncbi:uncharacterized protein J3R85_012484 [Psidium guajava]|nr:uncharacterized protein J3R85_012484 [Psidium guajava]